MTQPIQEPSTPRRLTAFGFGQDQLFRRPPPPTEVPAVLFIKVFSDTQAVTTGNGKFIFAISEDMDGMNLVAVAAYVTTVSSSGLPTVQIRNITQGADMLSTRITIDVSEFTSYTAATAPVIDAANDDVAISDLIAIDVDVAGTGAQGLGVMLNFELP